MRLRKKETPIGICFVLIALMLGARVVLLLCDQTALASLCFKGTYVFVGLLALLSIYSFIKHKDYGKDGPLTLMLMLLLFFALFGLLMLLGTFKGSYLTTFTFLIVLLLVLSRKRILLSEGVIKLYFRFMAIVGIALCLALLFPRFYQDGVLLLYTGNPNQSGMLYMCVFINVFIYRFWGKRSFLSAAFFDIELLLLLFGCACTNSRSALITCLLCMFLGGLFVFKRSIVKLVLGLCWVFFVLFPLAYLGLASLMNGNVQIFGKLLFSGRETVWRIYLQEILFHPFAMHVGETINMSDLLYQASFNTHNAWLHVAWEYSLLAGILFLVALLILMLKMSRKMRFCKEQRLITACFCAGLFHMTFEASLIVGALDFTLLYLMPVLLGANYEKPDKKRIEKSNRTGREE